MNSGEDLAVERRAGRRRPGMVAALLAMLLVVVVSNVAATADTAAEVRPAVAAGELDQAIVAELERPQYAWRMRREPRADGRQAGWLELFFRSLGETIMKGLRTVLSWFDKVVEWLSRRQPSSPRRAGIRISWDTSLHWLVCALVVGVAAVLAVCLLRAWRRRRAVPVVAAAPVTVAIPDLEREDVGAEQLPADEWLALARQLAAQGELRTALRAIYLATLAHLGHCRMIVLARHKSNRDYQRELGRRGRARPEVSAKFAENVGMFEMTWYGEHPATAMLVEQATGNHERIRHDVEGA